MSGGDIKEAMIVSGATDEHLKAARILVEQARMSPEAKTKLFRGLSVDKAGTWLDTIQVGEDVTMSRLTSFSASREKAVLYADKSRGSFKYELHIEASSKSFATDKITGMGHMEHLTDGDFKVIKISGEEKVVWSREAQVRYGEEPSLVKMRRESVSET